MLFLTLDMGTTSVKTGLWSGEGAAKAESLLEYTLHTPSENIIELDAEIYWTCVQKGIKEVLEKSAVPPEEVLSIGVSSQGETLITLDAAGAPLMPAIVWMDNRSWKEAEELKAALGSGDTGLVDMTPTWPATKILWLKRNNPEVFHKAAKYCMVEDFIIFKLTGRYIGEYSLYSTTSLLDIRKKVYWRDILNYLGITDQQLPELTESAEIAGTLLPERASELGLKKETKVITGALDQTAGMIGAGNIEEGIITETTGGALAICKTLNTLPGERGESLSVQCHAVPERYLVTGWTAAGGMSLKWLRDTFFTAEAEAAERAGQDPFNVIIGSAEKVAIGSQGLLFYPFMAGPGTLPLDPSSRGSFYGLELHHTKAHFVRAVMESIAFVLRENIDRMCDLGGESREVRSMGGGAKSRFWNQMKADATGLPVITLASSETASLGIAVLSGAALGVYSSIPEAAGAMVKQVNRFEPARDRTGEYEAAYRRYRRTETKIYTLTEK